MYVCVRVCVCLWVEGVKGPFLSRWLSGLVTVWGSFTVLCGFVVLKGGFDPLIIAAAEHKDGGNSA